MYNAESPRMAYINPMREQPYTYEKYIYDKPRQGIILPYREHLLVATVL